GVRRPGLAKHRGGTPAGNFGQGPMDVFDEPLVPASLGPDAFKDANLPAGFVPFNVQQLGGHVFVTYAQKNGAGGGVIDEFNLDGTFVARIASNGPGGPLEAPSSLCSSSAITGTGSSMCSIPPETTRCSPSSRTRQRASSPSTA